MATNKSLINYAVQNVSFAANLADPTPSSKIRNITETLINEIDNFEDYGYRVLNNMFLDSCDASFLDRIGAQEGIQRLRAHTLRLTKESMFITLKNIGKSNIIRNIPQGYSSQISSTVWITFPESTDLSDVPPGGEKYVTVDIKIDVDGDAIDIAEDSLFSLDLEPNIVLTVNSPIYVPVVEESDDEYRARLMFARQTSKFGSEAAIKAAVASSALVTHYSIDYTSTPVKVYLFSDVLLYNPDYINTLETYSVNTVRSQLNQRKSAGTTFEVLVPMPVTFKVELKSRVSNPRNVNPAFYNFSDFIKIMFKFGDELVIDENFFEIFKRTLDVDLDFLDDYNIKIIQTYMNFDYAAENNSITIHKNEYPYLESLTVG